MTEHEVLPLEEDVEEYTLDKIYEDLVLAGELILTIPAVDEQRLRRGLAVIKAKEKKRAEKEGVPQDPMTLEFTVHEGADVPEFAVQIRVTLRGKNTIKVYKKTVPDDDMLS